MDANEINHHVKLERSVTHHEWLHVGDAYSDSFERDAGVVGRVTGLSRSSFVGVDG